MYTFILYINCLVTHITLKKQQKSVQIKDSTLTAKTHLEFLERKIFVPKFINEPEDDCKLIKRI